MEILPGIHHLPIPIRTLPPHRSTNSYVVAGPDTALVILETPGNPTLSLVDIEDAVRQAGEVPLVVDSTFMTPVLQRPLELGATLVLHSATKFLGGHGDVIAGIVAASEEWATRLRKVRVATGGAPPSPTLLARMEEMGVRICHLYGLTETYGPHATCEMQPEWEELDVAGRARVMARQGVPHLTATHLRVVDDAMQDVRADGEQMGEVVMRGNNVMQGYYEDPEATAAAFAGGWFHSGDLGVMHPDGYIELRDRSKDIIISGGENVSTIEVENTLYQHPDVQEVAVVGVPHEKWGEVPKAFVVPKPGTSPSEQSLIDFARERLAHFKCPKSVTFGELPKTATGKIQKFKLREQEWAGRERRIQG